MDQKDVSEVDIGDATSDKFSLIARLSTTGKHSAPRTVHVAIAARNIQPPYLTNHRPLRVNIGKYSVFVPYYRLGLYRIFYSYSIRPE